MFGLSSLAGGVIEVTLLALAPALAFWIVFNAARIRAWSARVRRGVRDAIRPRTRPVGPPIEQIAADIRRIAAQIDALPALASRARREGAVLAYDDALATACRALGVDDSLSSLPIGPTRDARRVRVECELELAGLVITDPRAA